MSENNHRRCAKCGRTRAEDMTVTYHKFPKPGKATYTKALAWAKFCWPNENWTAESLDTLHTRSKVLCGRHFNASQFYDNNRQKLSRFAVPHSTEVNILLNNRENVFNQNVEQAISVAGKLSRVPFSQIENIPMSIEPSTSAASSTQITSLEVSKVSVSNEDKQNVEQAISVARKLSRVPFEPMSIDPSTSAASSTQITSLEVSKVSVSNEDKQNVEQAISVAGKLSRVPFEPMSIDPSTSAASSTQITSLEVSKVSVSNEDKQINKLTSEPTSSKTTKLPSHIKSHSTKSVPKKRSGILTAINVSKLSDMTSREVKLYNICRTKVKELGRLRKSLKNKKAKITSICNDQNVKKLCDMNLSQSFIVLLQSQMRNCPKKPKGRRYFLNDKLMSLVLYKKSPACYRLLRRIFALPCQSSLNKLLNQVPLKPGINNHIFKSLKNMADTQIDEDNICILSFDEMAIRKHLNYDSKMDKIQGFQDHGNHGRNNNIASKALVFMIAGIRKHWKQPIAFYFSHSLTADRMTVIVKEVLTKCFENEINVVATVCDLSTVNIKVLKNLGATTREPFFMHSGREIVAILDPPHLLKCTRNLFMNHDVEVNTIQCNDSTIKGIAKWSHIDSLYKLEKNNPNFVYAPALTESHIHPNMKEKMRVKIAAQIFSHSVASGLYSKSMSKELPAEAHTTGTFVQTMDELFDAVNADSQDLRRGKKYSTNITEESPHLEFFQKMRKYISSMKYLGSRTTPPSQEGWIQTLNAIERLWKNLKTLNIQSLPTRRLNQDPLENCFGCIRYSCGSNSNPTIQQFVAGIKTAIITNLRHTGHRKNCEDDTGILSNNLATFLMSKTPAMPIDDPKVLNSEEEEIELLLADATEAVEQATPESQACAYVCGFIFKRLRNNNCQNCIKAFIAENHEAIHIFTSLREYTSSPSLNYVVKEVVLCVETMAFIINNYLKTDAWRPHTKLNIMAALDCVDFSFLNKCPRHLTVNISHLKTSAFCICIKRYLILKNREMGDEEIKKSLERKSKILKNK